jgi:N-acetylmuramidase
VPTLPFRGNALALSSDGLSAIATKLGVFVPEIWTVLAVETSGCGYLADGRPQILFERHVFHRLTNGKFDDGQISDPSPGGYGPRGANQYDRLAAAIANDRLAALQSASWGIGQVMGFNFRAAGFTNVEDMIAAMSQSEDQQLLAMASFLIATGLHRPLQAHDWASFARGYNGPNYAINRYDIRLNGEFQKYSAGPLPDLNVRATQLYLTYLGFHPGPIDGVAGEHTLSALADFRVQRGLGSSTVIDDLGVSELCSALGTPISASAAVSA